MKKLSLFAAFFCLFLAGAAFAQSQKTSTANFAGTWDLDVAKSKLGERTRVESGTLTVTQTGESLTAATDFKRAARSENPPMQPPMGDNGGMRPEGSRGGMRGGGRGMMGGGNGTVTYSLDGKETKIVSEMTDGAPSSTLALKAETQKDGKLKLVSNRSFETQMGAMIVKTVDVWELLDNGKTLKITRETETPRGAQSAEMYFTKKATLTVEGEMTPNGVSPTEAGGVYQGKVIGETGTESISDSSNPAVKTINGGVINGKAKKLPAPVYPAAAKAVNASGTVSVEVIIDEQGNIVSARAVSGHPLLKGAAEEAARAAEFAPTRLSGALVRVKGIITYNFIL